MSASVGRLGPMKVSSPSAHEALASMYCAAGLLVMNTAVFGIRSGVKARKGEMSSMIQMPRPWVASTRSDSRGCTTMSRTATAGKSLPLYCAHLLPPSTEIHRPNSVPRNRMFGLTVSAHSVVLRWQRRPGLAVIGGLVNVRLHVAEGLAIQGDVSGALIEAAGRDRGDP